MPEVEALCNRITIVDHGKVIAAGTKSEIIAGMDVEEITQESALEDVFLALTGKELRE